MTELDPLSRQPMTPGSPRHAGVTSEQTARAMWWQQQVEREAAQQQPDPAYDRRLYPCGRGGNAPATLVSPLAPAREQKGNQ